jgi:hypothetical protein
MSGLLAGQEAHYHHHHLVESMSYVPVDLQMIFDLAQWISQRTSDAPSTPIIPSDKAYCPQSASTLGWIAAVYPGYGQAKK